ncbi:MAG: hypothetical protein ACLTSZ_04670 [Lachnospiraceae bacterium]
MEDKMNVRLPWPGWTVVKYLGEGGYGRVYEIERELSGIKEQAALKVVSRPVDDAEIEACYENGYDQASMKASYQEELQRYVKEYQLMKELQGQTNIVSCDDLPSRAAQRRDRRADLYPDGAAHAAEEGDDAEHAQ